MAFDSPHTRTGRHRQRHTSLFSILTYYRQIETEALRLGCAKVHTTTVNALIMTFDILQNSSQYTYT